MSRNASHPSSAAKRLFLQRMAGMAALGTGAPMALSLTAMSAAAAQSGTSDYKALVCVFLAGGNDAFNTVLPTDSASWSAYADTRGAPLTLSTDTLKTLSPINSLAGRTLALHPRLDGLQQLFNVHRRLAIVSNVGTMVDPLTKDEYTRKSKSLPSKLFSHNDQQSTWQALGPEGVQNGWGGRLAELVASAPNANPLFTGISAAGNAVWVSGRQTKQYQIQPTGVLRLGRSTTDTSDLIYGSSVITDKLRSIAQRPRTRHVMEADIAEVGRRSIEADQALRDVLPSDTQWPYGPATSLYYNAPTTGTPQFNPLAQQLQVVARAIGARNSLGMKRQVFFVSLGGFDTHDSQIARHADLMARLNHAMVYFDGVLSSMGLLDQVTTFTASDFGRTFTSNGDGTDHGWGAHHFVMGGAVNGGVVAGTLPTYSRRYANNNQFSSPDQLLNGALLPSTSVEQYGSALGRWFGLSDSLLADVFPNLSRQGNKALGLF